MSELKQRLTVGLALAAADCHR